MPPWPEGAGSETINCECGLDDGSIEFSPNLFGGMLDAVGGSVIELHLHGPDKPALICDPTDENLTVLAMPLKPRGPVAVASGEAA